MINLLPISDVKKTIVEYRMRLTITALLMLALVLFIAVALLVPSYLLASHKRDLVQNEFSKSNDQGASAQEMKNLKDTVTQTEAVVALLGANGQRLAVSDDIMRKISGYGANGITITGIYYDAKDVTQTISLRGSASTRQNLTDFADILKKDRTFSNVSLPISDLVRDKNISFTIMIKVVGTMSVADSKQKK